MKQWVCKERVNGKWVSTYFETEAQAKKLTYKILNKGGRAVWMRVV